MRPLPRAGLLSVLAALGLTAAGCARTGLPAVIKQSATVAISVQTRDQQTLIVTPITINGRGPFNFRVDTGASRSVIYSRTAAAAGLKAAGGKEQVAGIGCESTVGLVQLTNWRDGELELPKATLDEFTTTPPAQKLGIGGLIGSDVLSRFGSAAIDFTQRQLRVGPTAAESLDPPVVTLPVQVARHRGTVAASVAVYMQGRGPFNLLVDSGAAESVVDAGVATSLRLPVVSPPRDVAGVSCTAPESTVKISTWRLGALTIPGQEAATLKLGARNGPTQIDGLLGAYTMSSFGAVGLDYTHARLVLEESRVVCGKPLSQLSCAPPGTAATALSGGLSDKDFLPGRPGVEGFLPEGSHNQEVRYVSGRD